MGIEQRLSDAAGRIPDATPPELEALHRGRRRRRGRIVGAAAAVAVLVMGSTVALSSADRNGGQEVRVADDPEQREATTTSTTEAPTTTSTVAPEPTSTTSAPAAPPTTDPAPTTTAVAPTTTAPPKVTATPRDVPRPTLEPSTGPPGTAIRLSGTGCTLGSGIIAEFDLNGEPVEGAQPADVDEHGNWSIDLVVPDWFEPSDTVTVGAACFGPPSPEWADRGGAPYFQYDSVPFDVR